MNLGKSLAICLLFIGATNYALNKYNKYEEVRINNSLLTVKISGGQGSGVLIKLQEKTKILTNAHVCLGFFLQSAIDEDLPQFQLNVHLSSAQQSSFYNVNTSELEYNVSEDWCLIPVDKTPDYPILTAEHLTIEATAKAINLTYNHKKSSNKGADTFHGCAIHPEEEDKASINCHKLMPVKNVIASGLYDEKFKLKLLYLYNFPSIPGDSGSPTFTTNGKLMGLVSLQRSDARTGETEWSMVTPMHSLIKKYKN